MKKTVNEIAVVILLAITVIIAFPLIEREWNRNIPIDQWFNIRQLEISADTPVGQLPNVIYDREVLQPFTATYTFIIQSIRGTQFDLFCSGSGTRKFAPEKTLPNQGETTAWFTHEFPDCAKIKDFPGTYRGVVTWNINRGTSYYPVTLEKITNVFRIVNPEEALEILKIQENELPAPGLGVPALTAKDPMSSTKGTIDVSE